MANSIWHPLRLVSLASGLCLFALMVLSISTGANQQHFEVVLAPQTYAADLLDQAAGLKWIVALDDVFIACYVTVSILFATHLTGASAQALRPWIVGMGVAAGGLDFVENHHILAMLHQAQAGGVPDIGPHSLTNQGQHGHRRRRAIEHPATMVRHPDAICACFDRALCICRMQDAFDNQCAWPYRPQARQVSPGLCERDLGCKQIRNLFG